MKTSDKLFYGWCVAVAIFLAFVIVHSIWGLTHRLPNWTIVCDGHGRYSFTGSVHEIVDDQGYATREEAEFILAKVRAETEAPVPSWKVCAEGGAK